MSPRPLTRARAAVLVALATALATLATGFAPAAALADHTQESVFQDDQYLLDSSSGAAIGTMVLLKALGVQRVRVNVLWSSIAPTPDSRIKPANFNAANPSDYPAGSFAAYDRLVEFAKLEGLGVEFNITAPGPLWAMAKNSPTSRAANHWEPNASEFLQFVFALGVRYSGAYAGLPRVNVWSIWNEPDQPGWLAPQSLRIKGREVAQSPRLYRDLVRAGFQGLYYSGHTPARDSILIGELAPEGYETPAVYTAMTPLPFLRDLYCVSNSYRPLRGNAATALGCPRSGSRRQFVAANPDLFRATGFAHHPYYFFHPPNYSAVDPNFAPLADLGRLERALDRSMRAWGVHRRLPVYLTEYGYQTKPPDPYQNVSPAQQATYLNQADYMAWRDPRVRSVAQFLLFDSAPDSRYTPQDFSYWDTFQTGLLYAGGKPKPAFTAYALPIWIPSARFRRGTRVFIWAELRAAPHNRRQSAKIQWRPPSGSYRTLSTVTTTSVRGYLTARVRPPGTGAIRIAWTSARGVRIYSRGVPVNAK
ncbi:MAG: hypothetical protein M3Z06_15825 [Actinomycetota bacterium]|nr:hypothetical protein [Actinomycetota bacterium]